MLSASCRFIPAGYYFNSDGLFQQSLKGNIIIPIGVIYLSTKTDVRKIVGKNLCKYRRERNLSQIQVAEIVGLSAPFYANIERGAKGLSLYSLRELANALGVSTDYLLFDDRPGNELKNVEALLRGQPAHTVVAIEKMIALHLEDIEQSKNDA